MPSIRRALFTVSDKAGIVELARALAANGTELVATGKTATVLEAAGLKILPIEKISGSPEAFQGRMKTLSFPVCSGILFRRGDAKDEADLSKLGFSPIDCVVVNFYPFEAASARPGISRAELIEEIDIGGPTLVRAAAKNAPDVLVLTDPRQYGAVIAELESSGRVAEDTANRCAGEAWQRIHRYDAVIAEKLGLGARRALRYGENPHQQGFLEYDPDGAIAWDERLTQAELSYNNILDLSSAYALANDLIDIDSGSAGVVIVKHNNPCGVAMIQKSEPQAQKQALLRAWEGDPVSAFGGVVVFTDPLQEETASWLAERFIELVAAPGLSKDSPALNQMLLKRRNLKAVGIRRFGGVPRESMVVVPGGRLYQSTDRELPELPKQNEEFKSATKLKWPSEKTTLVRFGIVICRALKSNAIALVRAKGSAYQLVGARRSNRSPSRGQNQY